MEIIRTSGAGEVHNQWSLKKKILGFLGLVITGLSFACAARADQEVTLAWDPDPSGTVMGYAVYEGTASGVYTERVDVGTNTTITVNNLVPGTTNYFAVVGYTAFDESAPSAEIAYIVPGILRLIPTPQNFGAAMQFPVAPGHVYEVQASPDLRNWTTLWLSPAATSNCWMGFADLRTRSQSQFYRLIQH